jgi:predicted NBD/HSP70 family sugar kinase
LKNTNPLRRGILRPKQVRGANSAVVLQLLRRFDRISRADLARRSGLSEGTVSRIIAGLREQRLVSEVGAENSTGGRPATRLQLSDAPRSIGVEIQNWETRFAVASTRGTLVETSALRTPATPKQTVEMIAEQVKAYCQAHGRASLHGIGVTARGIVNSRTGVVELGNDPGWVNVPLQSMLEAATRLPVHVEHDVRAAAAAEYNYTNAGELAPHCLLYVRVDEGVGVGLILNGEVYTGPSMAAGEFGQMVIADDGSNSRHDRPGCLEKLVSNMAVCDRFAAAQGRSASASTSDSAAKVRRICQRAADGDEAALQVIRATARYLAIGIMNVAWGLDPEIIVLNATLNTVWPMLLESIEAQFPSAAEWPTFRRLRVQQSALGEQGTLIGAATLAFAPLFQLDRAV